MEDLEQETLPVLVYAEDQEVLWRGAETAQQEANRLNSRRYPELLADQKDKAHRYTMLAKRVSQLHLVGYMDSGPGIGSLDVTPDEQATLLRAREEHQLRQENSQNFLSRAWQSFAAYVMGDPPKHPEVS